MRRVNSERIMARSMQYERMSLLAILIYTVPAAVWDIRSRCVPVRYLLGGSLAAAAAVLMRIARGDLAWYAAVLSTMPGLMLLLISWGSDKKIGAADGILFFWAGPVLGLRSTCILLTLALLLACLCSILLLVTRRGSLKTQIPFLPFVAGGSLLQFLATLSG